MDFPTDPVVCTSTCSQQSSPYLATLTNILSTLSPAQWCQSFFLFYTAGVTAVALLPKDVKALVVEYGARKSSATAQGEGTQAQEKQHKDRKTARDKLITLIAQVTTLTQVPHAWFAWFYTLSLACSAFWLGQYLYDGRLLHIIATAQFSAAPNGPSVTLVQTALAWTMMLLQAARRAYEDAAIMKPSAKSTMWVVHLVLGLGFYAGMGVAVWVEGSVAILSIESKTKVFDDANAEALIKIALTTPAFLYAWINQHRCHRHLAGLEKYSLPSEGLFCRFVCAHYTCECLLYLAMAVGAAPQGQWINRTLLCALLFVVVNLGVTAAGTRRWYAQKFGAEAVRGKWNMIPFVF
ncbi:uncharacterized protein CTHT_0024150 [Thermochaetoides thermophila DSM 1495]|uniref:Polyprenal reductase n=1 Tax=Chaetomium thermophilum (strain DSM 1495 / CBS 144.50 / IMI 039719) TaxID=759272 RepID=G0S5A8_CHATD|nr:hypothetical protein CTHT_0024150 [Thermochaetoides thermophila DSM 1495]EGS20581.1 hypothetical protein CTHT_0024150 [Thermochaetoides thermophila DSM 1495]